MTSKRVEIRLEAAILKALDDYCDCEFISRSKAISEMIPRFLQSESEMPVNVTGVVTLTGKPPVNLTEPVTNTGPLDSRARAEREVLINTGERDPGAGARAGAGHTPKARARARGKGAAARRATASIIGKMNERRPSSRGFRVDPWVKTIGRLLKAGHTVSEMLELVDWRANECEASGDWQWFKPDTLFRASRFAGYLDTARAGIKLRTPAPRGRGGAGAARAARFRRQKGDE